MLLNTEKIEENDKKTEKGLNFFQSYATPYNSCLRRRQSLLSTKNIYSGGQNVLQRQSYHGSSLFQLRGRLKLMHSYFSNQGLNALSESTENIITNKIIYPKNYRNNTSNFANKSPLRSFSNISHYRNPYSNGSTRDNSPALSPLKSSRTTKSIPVNRYSSVLCELHANSTGLNVENSEKGDSEEGMHKNSIYANRLFVGNLSYRVTIMELRNMFSNYGKITDIALIKDRFGLSKGYGLITFSSGEEIGNLIQNFKDCLYLDNRKLRIQLAENRTIDEKRYVLREN
ncbi:uncharacterized protein LOC135924520 isoform X2 [Gordionus sp. m RMFG-2023]|uniref:uncharacterized protein LOC135924520 isoform X2 n=1 Tax=Gordionus sp. m RMFG-2023 TaxID=3053472 RepID=UPI0031FCAF1A